MRSRAAAAAPYAAQGHDAVRAAFELPWFERVVTNLLREAGGTEVLDLGCGDGAIAGLALPLDRYVGVDLDPRPAADLSAHGDWVSHDLRAGLGPVGARPFDLYVGTFGVASHLAPRDLRRLLVDLAAHARPGAIVALEALGRHSLEWPQHWPTPPGPRRTLPYRLAAEVLVHPWSPLELFGLFAEAQIRPLWALDRTLQAGPKAGVYGPRVPRVRRALNALLNGGRGPLEELAAPLPPLPACQAALVHHTLAARRRTLVSGAAASPSAVWQLDPPTGGGFGHGLLVVGRVRH